MGTGESEQSQLGAREPDTGAFGRGSPEANAICIERDAVARDGMSDGAQWFNCAGRSAQNAAARRLQVRAIVGAFCVGEFPKVRIDDTRRTLVDEKPPAAFGDEGDESAGSCGDTISRGWQFPDGTPPKGKAARRDRTAVALRLFGRANDRAEFHEGLVERGAAAVGVNHEL